MNKQSNFFILKTNYNVQKYIRTITYYFDENEFTIAECMMGGMHPAKMTLDRLDINDCSHLLYQN